ncbi:DUF3299 domain-containing protein [Halopseudomonas nanhaiensis]|uniref:DUF3299 domain-containing protein n=1 Tax=Halopseudomonas nanhaiensis TaxID=2830842 RepID=UPI001CBE475A|nr:DUF3299 domain-containing protein [Halopseudomonas nanhaiensis]UAW98386.1 DUF3299 domain-containing protein [Halopseudomonas nanhaiensis]
MRIIRFALLMLFSGLVYAAPTEVDWLDLLPEEDYQAMLDMPEIGHDGGEELPGDFTASMRQRDDSLPEVMYSRRVVQTFDGKQVEIGGYPVPLETNEAGAYTLFFLVPYAGACIHVPPPPPNQIIVVEYPRGMRIDDIYIPLSVTGTLRVDQTSNELADASYSLVADDVTPYEGE